MSPQLPIYKIVYEKISLGRTDEASLTTSLGKNVVAKSSIDKTQITISCSSKS